MILALCLLLPPVFLLFIREKVLGEKLDCSFRRETKLLLRDYLLAVCLLNFVALTLTYALFGHDGALKAAFNDYTGFTVHYLMLSLALAVVEPFLENMIRFHVRITAPKPRKLAHLDWVLYAYAFILFSLNFIRIFDNAFWGDEGFTIRLAQMSVPDMLAATAADVHPPLFYFLSQLLYHIFGNNGAAYHLSALLPYAAIVVIACTAVKKRFGILPAAVLVTMSSLMKQAINYNVEARMYALAAMFVLISYLAFFTIIKENKLGSWIVFCISSLCAAYTHYYALISVAFLFVMLIPLAVADKAYWKGLIVSYAAAVVGYLPWLFTLIRSFTRTSDGWWLSSIGTVRDCLRFLFDDPWLAAFSAAVILCFFAYRSKIVTVKISDEGKPKDRLDLRLGPPEKAARFGEGYWVLSGLIAICGTAAVGFALSYLIRPFFLTRYLFPVSAVLYLIIGVCITRLNFRRTWGILLVAAVLFSHAPAYAKIYKSEHALARENTAFLAAVQPDEGALLVSNMDHLAWSLLEYYYPENDRRFDPDAPLHLDEGYDTVWLFWTSALDDAEKEAVSSQQYTVEEIYGGRFANGMYYHVYRLYHAA